MTDLSTYFENKTTPGTGSPIEASVFNNWGAEVEAVRDEAVEARDAAIAAAEQAAAPADDTIATLVASDSSATREQLDVFFASEVDLVAAKAELGGEIAALQAQSASTEDLCVSTMIQLGGTTTWPTTSRAMPLFSAPFPCQITRVSMVMPSSGGNVALSDTNYWLVELRRWNSTNTVTTLLGQKSTRATALAAPGGPASSGVPAGTAITARVPWEFTSAILAGATLAAGETLSWNTFTQGTPTQWLGDICVTISYRPL